MDLKELQKDIATTMSAIGAKQKDAPLGYFEIAAKISDYAGIVKLS